MHASTPLLRRHFDDHCVSGNPLSVYKRMRGLHEAMLKRVRQPIAWGLLRVVVKDVRVMVAKMTGE
jgi:hypothetical protein